MGHHVYILECKDKTYYTGYTVDIEKRISQHNAGVGAKYTRGRGPVKLVYNENFEHKKEALQREYKIKKLTRKQKEALIKTRTIEET